MIRAIQSWPTLIPAGSVGRGRGTCNTPAFTYSDEVVSDTLALDERQNEADTAMDQMRNVLGVDVLGWVSNEEYEAAKEMAREIKAKMLEAAETDEDRIGIQNHFPFDDFDELLKLAPFVRRSSSRKQSFSNTLAPKVILCICITGRTSC